MREHLTPYPDRSFVDTLFAIAASATRIAHESPLARVRRRNHISGFANTRIISRSIQFEIDLG
jgi:hypothetical protein